MSQDVLRTMRKNPKELNEEFYDILKNHFLNHHDEIINSIDPKAYDAAKDNENLHYNYLKMVTPFEPLILIQEAKDLVVSLSIKTNEKKSTNISLDSGRNDNTDNSCKESLCVDKTLKEKKHDITVHPFKDCTSQIKPIVEDCLHADEKTVVANDDYELKIHKELIHTDEFYNKSIRALLFILVVLMGMAYYSLRHVCINIKENLLINFIILVSGFLIGVAFCHRN